MYHFILKTGTFTCSRLLTMGSHHTNRRKCRLGPQTQPPHPSGSLVLRPLKPLVGWSELRLHCFSLYILIRFIPIWSLTSDLAHCFLKLVLSNVLTIVLQLRIRTYKYKYKRGLRAPSCYYCNPREPPGALMWAHTQVACNNMYCHIVQKMSPPYTNL